MIPYLEAYLFFSIPKDIAQLNLTVEKAPRQDIMFMKKVRFISIFVQEQRKFMKGKTVMISFILLRWRFFLQSEWGSILLAHEREHATN